MSFIPIGQRVHIVYCWAQAKRFQGFVVMFPFHDKYDLQTLTKLCKTAISWFLWEPISLYDCSCGNWQDTYTIFFFSNPLKCVWNWCSLTKLALRRWKCYGTLHSRLRRKKSKSKFWNAWRQFLCYRLCWTWWYHLFQNLRSFSWPLSCLKSSFLTLRGQIVFYPITLLQKSDTTTRLVSLWSARQGKSTDTRFCLFWPYMTLRSRDLRSNFDLGLSGSKHTSFDSSRREKHNGVRYFALDRSIQKLSAKNHMVIFGRWSDLWRHQMTENFKIGYQRRPFITANTLVSVPSHYLN